MRDLSHRQPIPLAPILNERVQPRLNHRLSNLYLVCAGLSAWVFLPLLTIPLAVRLARIVRTRTDGPSLNGALAGTGALELACCVLLSIGVLLS